MSTNFNINNESRSSENISNSSPETDLFQLPAEVTTLILQKLRPQELNIFQLTGKTFEVHGNHLKISIAQEFGYDKTDFLGSRKFLHEIYREIEDLKDELPSKYVAYDHNHKFDPETTLRNLQKLNLDDGFSIFSTRSIYEEKYKKTRNYLIKIADQLLSKSDPSEYQNRLDKMMEVAIRGSDVNVIKLCLNHGINIESFQALMFDPHKTTALLHACRYASSLDVFELLLSRGANINAQYASRSSVFVFIGLRRDIPGYNHEMTLAIAKLLLERGANPNIGDFQGDTPLHDAVKQKDFAYMNLLLKHGANIYQANHAGETPFSLALKSWNPRMINMCLLGFDPYAED